MGKNLSFMGFYERLSLGFQIFHRLLSVEILKNFGRLGQLLHEQCRNDSCQHCPDQIEIVEIIIQSIISLCIFFTFMKKELIVHYQGRPCKRKYPFRRLREARLTPNSLANCGFALGWKAKMPMVVNSFSHTYYYLQIVGKVMHVVDWQNVLIRGQFDALKRIAQIEIWHA